MVGTGGDPVELVTAIRAMLAFVKVAVAGEDQA
jgi:hypothetical protein